MITSLAALVLAAANASAQTSGRDSDLWEQALQREIHAQTVAAKSAAKAAAPGRVLDETLVAMNDGPEASGRVIAYLNEHGISVAIAKQAETVKTTTVGGKTTITISDAVPAHPRAYAPLIADEAAKKIYADMPACGERSYMIMATAARAFSEMGGDFKALPKIDGDDAPAIKDLISLWTVGAETAVDELARRDGVPTLPDLEQKAGDPKTAQALADQDKRFVAFLLDEREARRALLR